MFCCYFVCFSERMESHAHDKALNYKCLYKQFCPSVCCVRLVCFVWCIRKMLKDTQCGVCFFCVVCCVLFVVCWFLVEKTFCPYSAHSPRQQQWQLLFSRRVCWLGIFSHIYFLVLLHLPVALTNLMSQKDRVIQNLSRLTRKEKKPNKKIPCCQTT